MFRTILELWPTEISNSELYKNVDIKHVLHQLYEDTKKFFEVKKYNSEITENREYNLGTIHPQNEVQVGETQLMIADL